MKTAVIYARYSSDRQTEQSIEGQLSVCHEYASKNDIAIVDTYIDRAMTGTNDNRADFQRMIKDSYKKAWDYVIVYKLDRFSRDKYETAIHRRTLKNNGSKLVSAMENIPDTPEGIILESLLEGMNQYYSAELSQKVKRGMNESRKKGNFTGGYVLFGYTVKNKKLVIDEEQANIVKYIFSEFASGRLANDILEELRNKGILNHGRRFSRTTIYRILANEKYSGIYHYGNETFLDIYPKIVPDKIYDIVKDKLEHNKYGKHRPDVYYLLKNKLICGYCGNAVHSDAGTARNGSVKRYYKCSGKRLHINCEQNPIKKDILEDLIIKSINKTLCSTDIDKIADRIMAIHQLREDDKSFLNQLLKAYDDNEKAINNILTAIENGISTPSTRQRLEALEAKKIEISSKLTIEQNKEKLALTKHDVIKYFRKAIEKEPRQMFKLLVKNAKLFNDKVEIMLNYGENNNPDEKITHQDYLLCSISTSAIYQYRHDCNKEKVIYTIDFYV